MGFFHLIFGIYGGSGSAESLGPKNPFYSAYFYSRIVGLEKWNETS